MNIQQILKHHNKSVTPERVMLYDWMSSRHVFEARDIQTDFTEISRASVFRNLKLFVDIGILRRVYLGTGSESYELEHQGHHHEHMKCQSCGEVTSFDSGNICSVLFDIAKKQGFQVSEHSVNIFGTCKNCIL